MEIREVVTVVRSGWRRKARGCEKSRDECADGNDEEEKRGGFVRDDVATR